MTRERIALVTGASSGFGQLTARYLVTNGYRVFGTSRQLRESEEGVEMLELDVRLDESVRACVEAVLSRTERLDLLVNNAGVLRVGPAEEQTLGDAQELFDTNYFGAVRMTNAVLPTMRRQRSGHIINVGSLAGLISPPGEAHYAASKFALEGYSEALRHEVKPFGIAVSLIEPGFFRTSIPAQFPPEAQHLKDYDRIRETLRRSITQSIQTGGDPAEVAALIVHVAQTRRPRLRYRVGRDARWLPRVKAVLPEALFEQGVRRNFGLA